MKRIGKLKPWVIIIAFIVLLIGIMLINSLLIKGCHAGSLEEFTKALASKGYKISEIIEVKRPKKVTKMMIPEVQKEVGIDNLRIGIMIFADQKSAKDALNLISENGSIMGHAHVHWASPPHIYQSGKIIVTYVGRSLKMQWDLRNILGRQVKGGKWWGDILK